MLDLVGRPRRTYGNGEENELCYEQTLTDLEFDKYLLDSFQI